MSFGSEEGRESGDVMGELLGYRRDVIAAVLSNLDILSGALRSARKVAVCPTCIPITKPANFG